MLRSTVPEIRAIDSKAAGRVNSSPGSTLDAMGFVKGNHIARVIAHRSAMQRIRTLFPDLVSEVSPESIDPETYTFVAGIDATLVEQVIDIPK